MTNVTRLPESKLDLRIAPDGTKTGVCNLISVAAFSWDNSSDLTLSSSSSSESSSLSKTEKNYSLSKSSYENSFAVALAIQHLNQGDGTIVDAVNGLNETCNIEFVAEFIDTQSDAVTAAKRVNRRISREPIEEESNSTYEDDPCGFLGATAGGAETEQISVVTNILGYPMVSGVSLDTSLDHESNYPKFARTIPSNEGPAKAYVRYVVEKLNSEFLVILNYDDQYTNDLANSIRNAVDEYAPKSFQLRQIFVNRDKSNIKEAISTLKGFRITTIFAIFDTDFDNTMYNAVLEEAYKQDVSGSSGYIWFFPHNVILGAPPRVVVGSPLYCAYRGAGVVGIGNGYSQSGANPQYNKLIDGMLKLKESPESINIMESILPNPLKDKNSNATNELLHEDSFLNRSTVEAVSQFLYEATILMGLAACNATRDDFFLGGDEFYNRIVNINLYPSISGHVNLNNITGSRLPDSVDYPILNIMDNDDGSSLIDCRVHTASNNAPAEFLFEVRTTTVLTEKGWINEKGFIYNDGTTTRPEEVWLYDVKIKYANNIFLAIASIFCTLSITVAVVCAVWTWKNKKTRIIQASQPFFLLLICAGTIIVATAIIPQIFVNIDHRNDQRNGCSVACASNLWLLSIGFAIISSAFYSKMHRINKIMDSAQACRRIKVTVRDSIKTIVIVLTVNILILSLMTALDPMKEEEYYLNPDGFGHAREVFRGCDYSKSIGYVIALIVVNVGMFCLAFYEAWKARNLSTEFQESDYIFRALATILVSFLIGVPVMAISKDPNTNLFMSSAVNCIVCVSIQALLFVHKYQYQKSNTKPSSIVAGNSPGGISSTYTEGRASSRPSTRPSTYRELILSNKNRQELAEENDKLKNDVDRIEQKLDTLRRRYICENNNDEEEEIMTTSIVTDVESSG